MTNPRQRSLTVVERDRFLDLAAALFQRDGMERTTVAAICHRGHISLALFYKEFTSKDELIVAVLHRQHALWSAGLDTVVAAAPDPKSAVLVVLDHVEKWFVGDALTGCVFLRAFMTVGDRSPRVADAARDHKQSLRLVLRGLILEAGSTEDVADAVWLVMEGVQVAAAMTCDPEPAVPARKAIQTLLGIDPA